MFKLVLEKAEEPEIKLPTSAGSSKKQESSRKTTISALLTMPKPSTVWITRNWEILKDMGIPDHLTCLLRNLYSSQEATVRTRHGTTDWIQIGKGVHQGCILSPCLFNLYAEYCIPTILQLKKIFFRRSNSMVNYCIKTWIIQPGTLHCSLFITNLALFFKIVINPALVL